MKLSHWLTIVLCLLFALPARAADPVERTNNLIQAFINVKPVEEGKPLSPEDRKHNEAAYAALDDFFAYDIFLSSLAAPFRAGFTQAQYDTYTRSFREVIRLVAYPDSGIFLKKAKLKVKAGKVGETVDVDLEAYLEEEDLETGITFHWKEVDSRLRIVDVSFDGTSLVKDYQNQFGRIIGKEGVEGLLKKLDERLNKEQTRTGADKK